MDVWNNSKNCVPPMVSRFEWDDEWVCSAPVLVINRGKMYIARYERTSIDDDERWVTDDSEEWALWDVTHWMPLPQQPTLD